MAPSVSSTSSFSSSSLESFKCCQGVCHYEEMNPRHRHTMEDCVTIIDNYMDNPQNGYFAVYDGHGGREVSSFLKSRLHENLAQELLSKAKTNMWTKLECAFITTDIECCELYPGLVGSTACVVLLHQEGPNRMLYASNVGDSRAVMCVGTKAVALTQDHKADHPEETKRIIDRGGFVLNQRVLALLAVSRSFGDRDLKPFVIPNPVTTCTNLNTVQDARFVVIACDGLWDELSSQDVVDFINKLTPEQRPQAAELLTQEAMKRNSYDNISAIVIFL